MDKISDCILVSAVFTRDKDEGLLIVGRKRPNDSVEIINAFQGEEAWWMYKNLVTKKEKIDNGSAQI